MTLKLVDAYERTDGITVVVDLDAENVEPATDQRLLTLQWGSYESSKVGAETKPQYLNRLRNETRGLARLAAEKRGLVIPAKTSIPVLIGVDVT